MPNILFDLSSAIPLPVKLSTVGFKAAPPTEGRPKSPVNGLILPDSFSSEEPEYAILCLDPAACPHGAYQIQGWGVGLNLPVVRGHDTSTPSDPLALYRRELGPVVLQKHGEVAVTLLSTYPRYGLFNFILQGRDLLVGFYNEPHHMQLDGSLYVYPHHDRIYA